MNWNPQMPDGDMSVYAHIVYNKEFKKKRITFKKSNQYSEIEIR